jgi:hypothetical protein
VPRVVGPLTAAVLEKTSFIDSFAHSYILRLSFSGFRGTIALSEGDDARAIAQRFRQLADDLDPRSPV